MATEGVFAIKPPRLEDAGLEETALSPEGIQEAFRIAASKARGTATGILSKLIPKDGDEGDTGCTTAPMPIWGDVVVEGDGGACEKPGSCVDTQKGGLVEEGHDAVVDNVGSGNLDEHSVAPTEEGGPKLGESGCLKGDGEALAAETKMKEKTSEEGPGEDAPGLTEAAI